VEAKGFIEGSIVDEYREESEDVEEMSLKLVNRRPLSLDSGFYLRNAKQSRGVTQAPMTKFMS